MSDGVATVVGVAVAEERRSTRSCEEVCALVVVVVATSICTIEVLRDGVGGVVCEEGKVERRIGHAVVVVVADVVR